jgi:hypothetical protein
MVLLSRLDVTGAELACVVLDVGDNEPPFDDANVAPWPPPATVSLTLPCDDEVRPGTTATLGEPTVDAWVAPLSFPVVDAATEQST